jgi:hypothetical protein
MFEPIAKNFTDCEIPPQINWLTDVFILKLLNNAFSTVCMMVYVTFNVMGTQSRMKNIYQIWRR